MRETPYFKGSLDPNYYLKWVHGPEVYPRARDYLNEECFMIAIQKRKKPRTKNSKVLLFIGLNAVGGKNLLIASLDQELEMT